MANKKLWLGMLAMALTFGMTVVGCDNGSTSGNNNDPLGDGVWVYKSHNQKIIMGNGNWEIIEVVGVIEYPNNKGIYTISGNTITMIMTHLYFSGEFQQPGGGPVYTFEDKYYSESELRAIVGYDIAFEEMFPYSDWTETYTYSVTGNTFTMFSHEDGTSVTLARQN